MSIIIFCQLAWIKLENKHEHNNDDDDDDNEGKWEGVADVRATSGATWLTLPRSVGGLDVGLRL